MTRRTPKHSSRRAVTPTTAVVRERASLARAATPAQGRRYSDPSRLLGEALHQEVTRLVEMEGPCLLDLLQRRIALQELEELVVLLIR